MYNTLRELHRKFCKVMPVPELERQYEEAFRELMHRLEKPERKLVLKAIDTKGLMMEDAVFDGFVCGVRLALGLTTELQHYVMSTEQSKKPCGARHSGPFVV